MTNECSNGSIIKAFDYIMSNCVTLETNYPHIRKEGICRAEERKRRIHIDGYGAVPFKGYDETFLMKAVLKQPIIVSLAVERILKITRSEYITSTMVLRQVRHDVIFYFICLNEYNNI
jgi:hypothetical protein